MAKYERSFTGDFADALRFCERTIEGGSVSISLEERSDQSVGDVRLAIRAYERYSYMGGNRVSLNLTLAGHGNQLYVCAISTGGSQAMFFKINRFGEEAFLETLSSELDRYIESSR